MNIKSRKQCLGLGLIGWIAAIPFILFGLVAIAFLFCEANKAYWDYRVTEMCEEDGGIIIYETVELNESEYSLYENAFGQFTIPRESKASNSIQIVSKDKSIYIHRNNPEVRRNELSIIRKEDNKLLGVRVSYSRVGGDILTGISHPSIFRCPEKLENVFSAVVPQAKEG